MLAPGLRQPLPGQIARLWVRMRMLAGLGESAHARRHAAELLERGAGARPVPS